MREYKFRGKSIQSFGNSDIGSWFYGGIIINPYGDELHIAYFDKSMLSWRNVPVDPATVGQYTGLQCNVTDEEWYERDILTPDPHSKRTENEVICYDSHQGKYKSVPISMYLANAGNGGWTGFEIKSYQKRIGNVIDNPELLEG